MKLKIYSILFVSLLLCSLQKTFGQVTTSAINGVVLNMKSEPLPFANILLKHEPTGSIYGTVTRIDGKFNLPNLKSGGPYTIKVSYMGYQDDISENVMLALGEDVDFAFILTESSVTLKEVVITAKSDPTFNSSRTGAATNITKEKISMMPTISRSINDYTRLNPQAISTGGGTSFAGSNNRYNNFSIDGTVNNDVFGLSSSGTNGGQAGTQPVSIDVIDEIKVVVAPYDVRQGGFTGGGINAITKSGTNEFKGSAYTFFNNQNFAGKSPVTGSKLDDYTDLQMGGSIGGPIIKNKLFFFTNLEYTTKSSPSTYNVGEGSAINADTLQQIENKLISIFGDNLGGYGKYTRENNSKKFFVRFDYNINDKHKLSVRYNLLNASNDILSRNRDNLTFNNGGYTMVNNTHTAVLELHSRFSNQMANELRFGVNIVRDKRDIMGKPAPYIRVNLKGGQYVDMGTERYSMANTLDQNVISLTDNLNYYFGKHTFTIGTHNEFFQSANLFIRENYGSYTYNTLADFLNIGTATEVKPKEYNYSYSINGDPKWAAKLNAIQLGVYFQDEFAILQNLKITGGIRFDLPMFMNEPSNNVYFNDTSIFSKDTLGFPNVKTNQMPGTQVMISPRIGFNWDVLNDKTLQVRGGTGLFTGRVPFVWVSNQFSNTGIELARFRATTFTGAASGFTFNSDPYSQPTGAQLGMKTSSSEINVMDKDFKYPQAWRTNIAIDKKLPYGIVASIEGIYTKRLNEVYYQNLNLMPSDTVLYGVDNRPIYKFRTTTNASASNYDNRYTSVIYMKNTDEGYSYSITAALSKSFKFGLDISGAYTYGESKDIFAGTSSQAYSNWSYNEQYDGSNSPELSYSDFDVRHRALATVSYKIKYFDKFATSIGLVYNGQTGSNFSYVYKNDLNNDGVYGNDLFYVPRDKSEINLVDITSGSGANTQIIYNTDKQWEALDAFIENDPYLKERRGQYAERNAAHTPFVHLIDLRFAQDFYLKIKGKNNTLQLTFDILNVANLINEEWGRVYSAGFSYQIVEFAGFEKAGTTATSPYTHKAKFKYTPTNNSNAWQIDDYNSRWRAQIGIRYIFN